MKKVSNYQTAKALLKERASFMKKAHSNDKPLQREVINNHLDFLCINYQFSDYQRNLLSNYACKLHPKK
jgi:hypothetical protein